MGIASPRLQNVRNSCLNFLLESSLKYLIGQHAVRGATKEKARGLEDLKARRKAKEKRVCIPHLRFLSVTLLHMYTVQKLTKTRSFILTDGHGD